MEAQGFQCNLSVTGSQVVLLHIFVSYTESEEDVKPHSPLLWRTADAHSCHRKWLPLHVSYLAAMGG